MIFKTKKDLLTHYFYAKTEISQKTYQIKLYMQRFETYKKIRF